MTATGTLSVIRNQTPVFTCANAIPPISPSSSVDRNAFASSRLTSILCEPNNTYAITNSLPFGGLSNTRVRVTGLVPGPAATPDTFQVNPVSQGGDS